ncbi:transcriptional repressor [Nocardioides sp. JQ2195]|uniref:Fur family transcriptional regulator n=1 Tax=Nocardioides sp. JQ2195 TaxID=2592334 RepID=UPI00143E3C6E|nr:Fur family transcriptional regulator [Nocardioides sp. JQ2195]QIX25510.1 transcriptional repressor [Nocardioides sp. JQ2195]
MSDDFAERIRSSGKRMTPQRELILRAVDTLGHATPEQLLAEVHKHSRAVNLSTVYRNLEVLEELGLVRHMHLSDRAPTYHSVGGAEHFHLICRGCEKVISVDPEVVEQLSGRLQQDFGFLPDIGHLTVFGSCADCRDAPA